MTAERLRAILARVQSGDLDLDAGLDELKHLPFEDLGFARIDHHRALRTGTPEVIFGEGKTPEQIVAIALRLAQTEQNVLVTRIAPDAAVALQQALPETEYDAVARLARIIRKKATPQAFGTILVVAAGTTDLPVAEEAVGTLEALGHPVERLYDVGVAGLHRLLSEKEAITQANVLIVVAGMEGALPTVVAGLVERPVIAVPTSVGYGAALAGFTALLGMLTSCAAGITVVNIDNGFGAAMAAARINTRRESHE
ncbi:MAG: nickel pincer cofactor biosynthesis protein LarB [Deltaproteobacteria bacterium]